MIAAALCAVAPLLVMLQVAHGQPPPPPAAAMSPAPSMSITLLGPAPAPATTQMPVDGKLPHLAGTPGHSATIRALRILILLLSHPLSSQLHLL